MNQSTFSIGCVVVPESLIHRTIRPKLFSLSSSLMVFPLAYIYCSILELLTYTFNVHKVGTKHSRHHYDLPSKCMGLTFLRFSEPFHFQLKVLAHIVMHHLSIAHVVIFIAFNAPFQPLLNIIITSSAGY